MEASVERPDRTARLPAQSGRPVISATGTMEIQAADILEEIEVAPGRRPTSIAPMAIDAPIPAPRPSYRSSVWLADLTSQIAAMPRQVPRHFKVIVASACALSVLIIVAAAIRTHLDAEASREEAAALTRETTSTAGPVLPPPAEIDINSLPQSSDPGKIEIVEEGKVFKVDGVVQNTSSVIVSCGTHTVQLGSDKPRKVDVPCGATVEVSSTK
mgnify:CR=1 FL=1